MIAKGNTHNNGAKLATYLTTGKDNERATLWQLRGFASDDIVEAFRSVHVMAEALPQCQKPFFHVQVRNPEGETLTREQWECAANRIEAKLGLTDQPRAIAFHRDEDTGHEHMHVAWSRIDGEKLKARALPFYQLRLKEVCRELEIELGLTRVTNDRRGPALAPNRNEHEQARRLGVDIHETRNKIRDCFERSDNGRAFETALAEHGLTLAKGQRRDYIVLDRAGGMHALGMRVLGVTAGDARQRLADIDRAQLPDVEQARVQLGRSRSGTLDELDRLSAIEERNPRAFLVSLTKQRPTFTAWQLEWAVGKQIENEPERRQFVSEIVNHRDVVRLTNAEGAGARYTTRDVLEAEDKVLRAAQGLAAQDRHEVSAVRRTSVLNRDAFANLTGEQARAVRRATGSKGLALIDGQAGTGKSHALKAVREVYKGQGYKVVALAPTNAVAQDMKEDGFARARTLHAELFALDQGHAGWNSRTVVIVDEAAMIDTHNLARLAEHAQAAKAKLILAGDDRQLSSIERGGMFAVLRECHGAAELSEVRRQHTNEDRHAAELMARGNFREALASYEKKGGIAWTSKQSEAADALIARWVKDSAIDPSKSRFVFAYTNREVDELNTALRQVREQRGELGPAHSFETKHGTAEFAAGDRLQFTGTDKQRGLLNGQAGTVKHIADSKISVALDGRGRRIVEFDAKEFQAFRHGYAGTVYKGQGRTIDQTYLYHSEYWRAATSYVALTRHRDKTELFVARETAADLPELARQMSRVEDRLAASHFLPPDHGQKETRMDDGTSIPVTDARIRYAQARGENYDRHNPYASLARAATAEHAVFQKQQQELDKQITLERNPQRRRLLELRKEIEGCDYMAVTSERLARQSEFIAGRTDSEEALQQRAKARLYQDRSEELRDQRDRSSTEMQERFIERLHGQETERERNRRSFDLER